MKAHVCARDLCLLAELRKDAEKRGHAADPLELLKDAKFRHRVLKRVDRACHRHQCGPKDHLLWDVPDDAMLQLRALGACLKTAPDGLPLCNPLRRFWRKGKEPRKFISNDFANVDDFAPHGSPVSGRIVGENLSESLKRAEALRRHELAMESLQDKTLFSEFEPEKEPRHPLDEAKDRAKMWEQRYRACSKRLQECRDKVLEDKKLW